jgi:hypothetical protein
MGVPKQARGGVAKHFVCDAFVTIAALADRKVPAAALFALPADDRERDHDALADL